MIHAPLIPLQLSADGGYQKVAETKQLVKFHLINLLMTSPGERIQLPNYGVGLRRFLFEPLTSDTLSSIESRISSQVSSYLTYLTIDDLSVGADSNNDYLVRIKLSFSVDSVEIEDVLVVDLDYSSMSLVSDAIGVNY